MAIDVSLTMRASDVQPSRMDAAQAAAKAFVHEQPSDVRIGIVTFAGTATVVQAPTRTTTTSSPRSIASNCNAHRDRQWHDRFAVDAVSRRGHRPRVDGVRRRVGSRVARASGRGGRDVANTKRQQESRKKPFKPVAPGSYRPRAIILLTDGRRTTGPDSIEAAKIVADHGVRVYTVGLRIEHRRVRIDGYSIYMSFDEAMLKSIAEIDPRRVLLRRHRRGPEEDLPGTERQARAGEEGHRNHDAVHRTRGAAGARVGGAVTALVPPHCLME